MIWNNGKNRYLRKERRLGNDDVDVKILQTERPWVIYGSTSRSFILSDL